MAPSSAGMKGVPSRRVKTERFPPSNGPSATPPTWVSVPVSGGGGSADSSSENRRSQVGAGSLPSCVRTGPCTLIRPRDCIHRCSAVISEKPTSTFGGPGEPAASAGRLLRYRSEEHTSELQSHSDLVCRLLLEKKKQKTRHGYETELKQTSVGT